jgi:hypothetical protein
MSAMSVTLHSFHFCNRDQYGLNRMLGSARARAAIKTEREPAPGMKIGGIHYGSAFGLFDSAAFSLVRSNRIEAAIGAVSKAKRKLT